MDNEYLPIGTKLSGYTPPLKELFECEHCTHFDRKNKASSKGYCCHPIVMSDPQVQKFHEHAMVDEHGCCTYYRNRE